MAIYRMIRESVFEPEAIERMTAAYEHALRLTDRQDPLTELVARKIIRAGRKGCQRCGPAMRSHLRRWPPTRIIRRDLSKSADLICSRTTCLLPKQKRSFFKTAPWPWFPSSTPAPVLL